MITEFSQTLRVPVAYIVGPSREKLISTARQLYWKVLRDNKGYTLQEIAEMTNRKSHATVISGLKRINNLIDVKDKPAIEMWRKVKHLHGPQ
jgi:chromosomal replication initiation ATPase DnaA